MIIWSLKIQICGQKKSEHCQKSPYTLNIVSKINIESLYILLFLFIVFDVDF